MAPWFDRLRASRRSAKARPPGRRSGVEVGSLTLDRKGSEERSWAQHRWHSLDANRYPVKLKHFEEDFPAIIREAIVGHAPPEPLLEETDGVIALGSCFAEELRRYLAKAGFAATSLFIPEGLNNTFAIRDFVSWCVTGEETGAGFRYDRLDSGEIREWKPAEEQRVYAERFGRAGAFVFTLGLAEVWQDRVTNGVFWRGVPEEIFDADRHVFRLTSVEENVENVERIVELVRRVNRNAPIVLTLSPVPLKATFRPVSCVTADCVSKSILRIALDQVGAKSLPGVYYWPSFEIVRWFGAHLPWPAYGVDDNKARHVSRRLVAEIMDAFVEAFYVPTAVKKLRRRADAQAAAGIVAVA
jgi:hypothetical protein